VAVHRLELAVGRGVGRAAGEEPVGPSTSSSAAQLRTSASEENSFAIEPSTTGSSPRAERAAISAPSARPPRGPPRRPRGGPGHWPVSTAGWVVAQPTNRRKTRSSSAIMVGLRSNVSATRITSQPPSISPTRAASETRTSL